MTKTGYTSVHSYIEFNAECDGSVSEIPSYRGTPL